MIFLVGTDDKRVTVADGNYVSTQYFEFFETFGINRAIPISILNLYLRPKREKDPLFWMTDQKRYYVVRVGNLDLMHRVAKACHAHGEHPEKTFEIASRYSFEMKVEIMAFGSDDSVFGVVANGLVEDTDFIPQLSNAFQTPELPNM
jgi:hypothetical protein